MTCRLLLLAIFVACRGSDRSGSTSSPELDSLTSIELRESDSIFVGEPGGMVAMNDGTLLIADKQNGTLHRFGMDGRSRGEIGSRGQGPDEWAAGPHTIYQDGDSLLVVADGLIHLRGLSWPAAERHWDFDVTPGSYLVGVSDGRVMLSFVDAENQSTLIQVAPTARAKLSGGPYPAILDANPFIRELFSSTAVTWLAPDTIAVAFQHTDGVFVGAFPNGPFEQITVPVIARRGAEQDLLRQIDANDTRTIERAIYRPSYPLALAVLPTSGLLASVTSDMTFVDGRRMTGQLFLSLIDRDRRQSCPDAALPVPADPLPYVAFRGDTLLVLTQVVEGSVGRTVIRRFLPSGAHCAWTAGGD